MIPVGTSFFALTTRGLEDVSQAEIAQLPDISALNSAYRRVTGDCSDDIASLTTLRTVDDVFLTVAVWSDLTHTRQALADIQAWSAALDLRPGVGLLRRVRSIDAQPVYAITVNFVGKRNYTAPEIKAAVQAGIAARYPRWRYSDDDGMAEVNLRVFIDHDEALVGLRIAAKPLYRRAYKQAHLPGSLKPSVAAALLQLAEAQPGTTLLDPFCGSGTILIEAAESGLNAVGGDLTAAALVNSQENSADAGVSIALQQWDAAQLPLADNSVDLVISNLPWGRQIQVDGELIALYQQALAEMRRVLHPTGKLLLLTGVPELLDLTGLTLLERREISLFGQNPQIIIAHQNLPASG